MISKFLFVFLASVWFSNSDNHYSQLWYMHDLQLKDFMYGFICHLAIPLFPANTVFTLAINFYLNRRMTKPTKWHVRPAKTQISLGIRPVWLVSSLSAWKSTGSLATISAHSEDSDQTGWMPRLVVVFAGCKGHFIGFVMHRLIYPFSDMHFGSFLAIHSLHAGVVRHAKYSLRLMRFKCPPTQWLAMLHVLLHPKYCH